MVPIRSFRGEHAFLSSFYPALITIETQWGTFEFPTAEHAFQAAKSLDPNVWALMARMTTPGLAKKFGSRLILRPDWDQVKVRIMTEIVILKFNQHPYLMKMLQDTAPRELIEENTWGDTFWGVCDKKGENYLGKILMHIRDNTPVPK